MRNPSYRQPINRLADQKRLAADGFTLLELIITLAIAAILVAVAVPQYTQLIKSQNTSAEATNLYNDLLFARSEAIKEGQFVSICVANTGMTGCGTGTWASGWIIYSNPGASATTTYTSGTDVILRTQAPFTSSDTATAGGSPAATLITFNRDGFGMNLGTSGLLITVQSTPVSNPTTRCVWLSPLGVPAVQTHGQAAAIGQGSNVCS